MTASHLARARFLLEQRDGVLFLRWTDTLSVTVRDVRELSEHLRILALDGGALMLVELNGMVTLSRRAFVLLAASLDVSAVACVGAGPVERVLVTHFGEVHQPPYPVEYFESRDQALSWLRGQAIVH